MWVVAAVLGVAVVASGLVPWTDASATLTELAPVLLFLVSITVVAELAAAAGLFTAAAHRAARWGRGDATRLWFLVAALGTVTTVLLSLDTTAVLLTPVVLALALRLGLPAEPFALLVVWLANTASLLLPVSNLTNLLHAHSTGQSAWDFARQMGLPALVAVTVTVGVLWLRQRHHLRSRYELPDPPQIPDPLLFRLALAVVAAFAVATVAGAPVAVSAGIGAALLLAEVVLRRRWTTLSWELVPWRLVLGVTGLFLVVAAARAHGMDDALTGVAGTGTAMPDLLRLAGVSAVASNVVNNLPAYVALSPLATEGLRPYALLVGTNLGPLVLMWGSLATLLWRERCRAAGVEVSWRTFAVLGVVGVPVLLVASTLALVV